MHNPDVAVSLSVRGLTKSYRRRDGLFREGVEVKALRGVDLEVDAGKTLAVVGPSGSGKSTLARCIAGLEEPTSGEIFLGGGKLARAEAAHRRVQMVFQDPGASLNPRFTATEALREPLAVRRDTSVGGLDAEKILEQVGLPASCARLLTPQLSGGQKARLALARALVALGEGGQGGILILDESLGSLDLSVRAQMINLLVDLQERRGLTYILITHDPLLAAHMSDETVVMNAGRIRGRRPSDA